MKMGKEVCLPPKAYEADAETPTEYWLNSPDGMWLQTFWCMVVDLRAFASYLLFRLQKGTRSPSTAPALGGSIGIPSCPSNNHGHNPNHNPNHKPNRNHKPTHTNNGTRRSKSN